MSLDGRLSELRAELAPPFSTTVTTLDGRTIVSVEGELDRSTVATVRLAAGGRSSSEGLLVLDLSATTFVDSSGLHLIEELAAGQAAAAAPALVLIGLTRPLQRAIELTAPRQRPGGRRRWAQAAPMNDAASSSARAAWSSASRSANA